MLLLLLSRFSRVRLCATPETAAHQAPPSLGFSRQEHWSGLPFPSPMHEMKHRHMWRGCVSEGVDLESSREGSLNSGAAKITCGIDQGVNQERSSGRVENLPTQMGVFCPGLKAGAGVCLPSGRVLGGINDATTTQQAEMSPVP